jgi:hypothetical protein
MSPAFTPKIGLKMQYQETSEWCWIAVATSINHFYYPASSVTQCELATAVLQKFCGLVGSACPNPLVLNSNPELARILMTPYSQSAYCVLDDPSLGIPSDFLYHTGFVGDALSIMGNYNGNRDAKLLYMPLSDITREIKTGRPIAVDIMWNSGPQHTVAIGGVSGDTLLICDPATGESTIKYDQFPYNYRSGATPKAYALTQKKGLKLLGQQ